MPKNTSSNLKKVEGLAAASEIKIIGVIPVSLEMRNAVLSGGKTLDSYLKECTELVDESCVLYQTTAYDVFSYLEGNRDRNEAHIVALMKSFLNDGYLFTIIYVNEKMEIIDGQHRFEAARRLALPIYFIVVPGWGIKHVSILNVQSKNWTPEDFMNTHVKNGNKDYIRFKEFYDKFNFDITTCQLILLGKRLSHTNEGDPFRGGQMKCSPKELSAGYLKAQKILDFKEFHPKGYFRRNFVDAMLRLLKAKGYDHKRMIEKLKKKPDLTLKQADSLRREEYLTLFIEKFNVRYKNKIKIK